MSDCCCGFRPASLILACSGASNFGQLTNTLAVRPAREKVGFMSCLAGLDAYISGFVICSTTS